VPGTVLIDCFPESAARYGETDVVVAVDVIRATTTAITAAARGFRCFPVPTIEAAAELAKELENPLLVGELGGYRPYGFDLDNSPAALATRDDGGRPLILLSTSGTRLIWEARRTAAVYVACLRNYKAQAAELLSSDERVVIIGAGARGEFREEDQLCCAWIARELIHGGFRAEDERTASLVARWAVAAVEDLLISASVDYLRRTNHHDDLAFVLGHVDDLDLVCIMNNGELIRKVA
jgi:2-phosphosulfolactate phosphatase